MKAVAIRIEPTTEAQGVRVVDPIQRRQYVLETPSIVNLQKADTASFTFPVTSTAAFETSELQLPTVMSVMIRDQAGELIAEIDRREQQEFEEGPYELELAGPIKMYLRVNSALTVSSDDSSVRFGFEPSTRVELGARSLHRRPAATISVPPNPRDLLTAISALGSALQTTTCERSFPTLRGHPPLLEQGERLEIPDGLNMPETGVELQVPSRYDEAFAVAPLAYYLGADVVPGQRPLLRTETGICRRLDTDRRFEREVERLLKQTFVLDCVTRTEGLYQVPLAEREILEQRVSFEFEELYGKPLTEQLAAYLEVPFEAVTDVCPEWKLTAHITPRASSIDMLPFVVDDLAVIRTPGSSEQSSSGPAVPGHSDTGTLEGFVRADTSTRNPDGHAVAGDGGDVVVYPEMNSGIEHAWIGDAIPVGASRPTVEGYRHLLARDPADSSIQVTVVCNEDNMGPEAESVMRTYDLRDDLPFTVQVERNLTRSEFRRLLGRDQSFLHYIGHTDSDGVKCCDGRLDLNDVEDIGVDAFLLNACHSYEQGLALVEAGAIGGAVTIEEVVNEGAVEVGQTVARLLHRGFPLRAAIKIVRGEAVIGGRYIVIGEGGLSIAQPPYGVPVLLSVDSVTDTEKVQIGFHTYPTDSKGIGSMTKPFVGESEFYLTGGKLDTFELTRDELGRFLSFDGLPIRVGGRLHWSDQLSRADF